MRALVFAHSRLSIAMDFMHRARWKALWSAVHALLRGQQLWLTALGRARSGTAATKHRIKAIDRLLGNRFVYKERLLIYRAVAHQLVLPNSCPIVCVDTSEVKRGLYTLTASVACSGRSFPILNRLVGKCKPNGNSFPPFLRDLRAILPAGCRPIFVTDGAFEGPWFDAVKDAGWNYVGRIRNETRFLVDGKWQSVKELQQLCRGYARNLGIIRVGRNHKDRHHRVCLSKKPKSGHRKRYSKKGTPRRSTDDAKRSRGANQAWVLVTSLLSAPQHVVDIYAKRMQIEETFRDTKNTRWGWSFRFSRSMTAKRIEVLLLIASIAYSLQLCIGAAGERLNLHRREQANTRRDRRVFSWFVLGALLIANNAIEMLSPDVLRQTIGQIRSTIRTLAALEGT